MQDDKRSTQTTQHELVDLIARAILRTWSDSADEDWADELVRENRRIEARAAIGAIYGNGYQILPCEVVQE